MTTGRSRSLTWGLVGAGDIARKRVAAALVALAPRAALLGVASRRKGPAEELAHEYGAARVFRDWRALLADPDIDAVYVSTPVDLHAEITLAAARAGKHVLCEKPMALNHRDCRAMIRAGRRAGVRIGVAYYRRFYPVVRRMRELLRTGAIGKPALAEVLVAERFNPVGRSAPRRWLVQKERSGGGPMMDFGCHRLDLLLYLLGDIRAVRAELVNLLFRTRDVEDHATALLSFASGATGHVTASHCLAAPADRFVIRGTAGSLVAASLGSGTLEITTASGATREDLPPHANLHFPLVEDFNQAVLAGKDPLVSGEEGARTSRVLDRIYGRR
jgi:predicted dehydrogenase